MIKGGTLVEVLHAHIEFDGKYLLTLDNHHLQPRPAKPYLHSHTNLELSCIKAGIGEYVVDDKVYDIRPGDIFIFNNIETHAIGVYPPEEMINMVIHFDPQLIWNIGGNLFDARYLNIFYNRSESFENRLDRNNPATKEIRRLFLEIEREFYEKKPEYELMIKVKLLNILVALLRHYGYTQEKSHISSKTKKDLKAMNKVIEYINTHLDEDIRLKDLADIAYMSPSYFSTMFKNYNGLTPTQYITRKRIAKAQEYLENTNKTVIEIASLCGYNNTTNFYKAFKNVTGKVPSDFR